MLTKIVNKKSQAPANIMALVLHRRASNEKVREEKSTHIMRDLFYPGETIETWSRIGGGHRKIALDRMKLLLFFFPKWLEFYRKKKGKNSQEDLLLSKFLLENRFQHLLSSFPFILDTLSICLYTYKSTYMEMALLGYSWKQCIPPNPLNVYIRRDTKQFNQFGSMFH